MNRIFTAATKAGPNFPRKETVSRLRRLDFAARTSDFRANHMNDLPESQPNALDLSRRDFVKTSSFAAAFAMFNAGPIFAHAGEAEPGIEAAGPPVKCAVIGI